MTTLMVTAAVVAAAILGFAIGRRWFLYLFLKEAQWVTKCRHLAEKLEESKKILTDLNKENTRLLQMLQHKNSTFRISNNDAGGNQHEQ